MKKECLLYKKLNDNLVQCTCCSHYCVIKNLEAWFLLKWGLYKYIILIYLKTG